MGKRRGEKNQEREEERERLRDTKEGWGRRGRVNRRGEELDVSGNGSTCMAILQQLEFEKTVLNPLQPFIFV